MKKFIFTTGVVLLMANVSECYAEKCIGSTGKTEITKQDCKTCGANCDWEIVDGKLSITGSGDMYNWSNSSTDIPWRGKALTSIDIGSGITSIGRHAFISTSLTSIAIPDTITAISGEAFCGSEAHLTELIIPDSWADDNINLGNSVFQKSCFATQYADKAVCANAQIVCLGNVEKCKTALAKFDANKNCTLSYCIDSDRIVAADSENCNSGNYYWNGIECVREPDVSKRTCCPVCADLDGYCSRIRYTLPEADEATSNDNENMIEWIFE
ncbi:MAG: leucine-rich repeat protein [Alphaproteobacteria bacterium]|nr:leucine-rich repeat protein [Alphaproteobacteria bacterium]